MAKKPAARKTPEQLKTAVWPDRESALRDLKASHMPERAHDYELREYRPDSWQLVAPGEPSPPIREDRVIAALRRKPNHPLRGTPKVIIEAKAPAKAPAMAKAKAKAPAEPRMSTEQVKAAIKASQPLFATANGKADVKMEAKAEAKAEATPTPAPTPTPEPPKPLAAVPIPLPATDKPVKPEPTLFSPLPREGRPYDLVITEGSAAFPLHTAHTTAIDISRRLRSVVLVKDKAGATVRTYDYAEIKRQQAANKTPGPKRGRPFAQGGESKFTRAARLLFRDQGATARELEKECGWERVGQRHVNRASKFNDDARIEVLGEKHWRLIKRQG